MMAHCDAVQAIQIIRDALQQTGIPADNFTDEQIASIFWACHSHPNSALYRSIASRFPARDGRPSPSVIEDN